MAAQHGGYRRPSKPAPVSGPGAHSRRTDGRQPIVDIPDAAYGEDATFRGLQEAAPLAQAGQGGAQGPGIDTSGVTPLGAPTAQPTTPVTDGAQYGAGAGPEALGLPSSISDLNHMDAQDLKRYLPVLISMATDPATPQGTKNYVRQVISYL